MMTEKELLALVQLLNRLPMTQAEQLWVQYFVAKMEVTIARSLSKKKGDGGADVP